MAPQEHVSVFLVRLIIFIFTKGRQLTNCAWNGLHEILLDHEPCDIWSTGKRSLYESGAGRISFLQIIGPVVDLQVCGFPDKNNPQRVFQSKGKTGVDWVAAF